MKDLELKGIYLVVDPGKGINAITGQLNKLSKKGVCAVQILDNTSNPKEMHELAEAILPLLKPHKIPLFVNNRYDLLKSLPIQGVHFDSIPESVLDLKKQVGRGFWVGVTLGNDLTPLNNNHNSIDYVSFCSMFPSSTQNSCELVSFNTVKQFTEQYQLPVFLAGGITPQNVQSLRNLNFSGIAVVSGIMNSENPEETLHAYLTSIPQTL